MSSDNGLESTDDTNGAPGESQASQAIDSDINEDEIDAKLQEAMQQCAPLMSKFRLEPVDSGKKRKRSKAANTTNTNTTVPSSERTTRAGTRNQRQKQQAEVVPDGNEIEQDSLPSKKKRKLFQRSKVPWADDDDDVENAENAEDEVDVLEKKRKGKGKAKPLDSDDDDKDVEVTAYIYVERPISQPPPRHAASSSTRKPTDEEKYIARGLITFTLHDDYVRFLSLLALQLPCSVRYIQAEKIMWRFQTPANSKYLPLSGEMGYASLIKQLRPRKPQQRILLLAMPPPTKPAVEEPHWPTVDEDLFPTSKFQKPEFDYSALDEPSTNEHVSQQKMTFDKTISAYVNELVERYPVNNYPQYPNMRVYHDVKMNTFFELNDVRLKLWASHMARQTATVDQPPVSHFFDFKMRLKSAPAPPALITTPVQPTPVPVITTTPAPPSDGGTASLVQIMILNMLQQQQQQFQRASLPITPDPTPSQVPASSVPASLVVPTVGAGVRSQPQSPAKLQLPDVSLSAFCDHYGISTRDQERLERLEFQPGDKLDSLDEADWKNFAGFTSLSWQRILEKTRQFLRDVQMGVWV
ncbi:hypothetical protein CVT24_013349 [Panaeolus cyanescens]|uniref:Uncharacterized protein n=1 Tax=Panaeolus cyanescens TaxID=181874 RepID=A0A409WD40_9AGAR|nr:hypothetical protein CVT24_013349 [Panaeolus cyanescens]